MVSSDENYSRIWLRKYSNADSGSAVPQLPVFAIRCFPYGISNEVDTSMDLLEDSKPAYYKLLYWSGVIAILLAFVGVGLLLANASERAPAFQALLRFFFTMGPIAFLYIFGRSIKNTIDNYVSARSLKVVSISVGGKAITLFLKGQEPITIPLGVINQIELAKSKSTDLAKQTIVISGIAMEEPVIIKLSAIHTHENWMIFTHAIANFSRHIQIDDSIAKALTLPSADTSFTELWLDSLSSAPESESLQAIPDGQTLGDGRYLVKSKLASGGQGHAYLCQDQTTNQEVVIKAYLLPVYQGKRLKDLAIQQLEAESVVLQRINHPQIVHFVDWFTTSSCAFLVLNRINGKNLRQHQALAGLAPQEAVINLTLQMCEILKYLHISNPPIIHRDFTPDNLILDSQHRLTLIDFTIAEPSGTVSGLPPAGKPAYMPPEQFRGEASLQSDIYALGGTLQFLLTGREPVALEQQNILLTEPNTSPLLAEIVYKCRAQLPKDRFQSVEEIIELIHSSARAQSNG